MSLNPYKKVFTPPRTTPYGAPRAVGSRNVEGRTTANFRCPCTDVAAPPGHSFWVELVELPGFPALLHGTCHRCNDKWVGLTSQVLGWYDVHRWLGGGCGGSGGGGRTGHLGTRGLDPRGGRGVPEFDTRSHRRVRVPVLVKRLEGEVSLAARMLKVNQPSATTIAQAHFG